MSFPAALNAAMIHGIPATTNHLNNPVALLGLPDLLGGGGRLIPCRVDANGNYLDIWEVFSDTDYSAEWVALDGSPLPDPLLTPGSIGWALMLLMKGAAVSAAPQGWKVAYLPPYNNGPALSWHMRLPNGDIVRGVFTARSMRATWEVKMPAVEAPEDLALDEDANAHANADDDPSTEVLVELSQVVK